jgi:HSP20 family protein
MAQLPARRSARNITPVDPSREFEDSYDRMGQLMSMAFGDLAFTPALSAPWTTLEDRVNVDVNDRELIISGGITEPQQEEGRRRRRARRTGRSEFRTTRPGDIKPEGVNATLSDGILTVTVPRSGAARPRHVEVTG